MLVLVNVSGSANVWQDMNVSENPERQDMPAKAGGQPVPDAAQVEILKALAAPIRLRIIYALGRSSDQRVMSVKELAEALGEPQTRLYRHMKVLESAGLIEVAATRLVSGIVEQRYRLTQRDFQLGPGLLRGALDASAAAVTTIARVFSEEFFAAYREGAIREGDYPDSEAYRKPVLGIADSRISAARATSIRNRLREIVDELNGPDDPDGVPVRTMISFYSPEEKGSGSKR